MPHRIQRALFILATLVAAAPSQAGIIEVYDSRTDFLALAGAGSITGPLPSLGNAGSSVSIGSVTLSTAPFATSTDIFVQSGFSSLISPNEIAISGSENLDVSIDLSHSVTSFGFDFHEPSTTGSGQDTTNTPFFHDSVFTIELFAGAASIGSVLFEPDDDVLEFFGVRTDMGFDGVVITESLAGKTYSNGIDHSNDNEFFGEFYAAPLQSVPAPAPLALVAMGLLGLVLRRIR